MLKDIIRTIDNLHLTEDEARQIFGVTPGSAYITVTPQPAKARQYVRVPISGGLGQTTFAAVVLGPVAIPVRIYCMTVVPATTLLADMIGYQIMQGNEIIEMRRDQNGNTELGGYRVITASDEVVVPAGASLHMTRWENGAALFTGIAYVTYTEV